MMKQIMESMTREEKYVFQSAMAEMDRAYSEDARLVSARQGTVHGSRASAYYVLGLLMRGEPGDANRAFLTMEAVLDMQLDYPGEVFNGTFKTVLERPVPPVGVMPIHNFGEGWYAYMDRTFENFCLQLAKLCPEQPDIERKAQMALNAVLPVVWETYDPNWREFIASCFALVLVYFEDILPVALLARLDACMKKAVAGSVERRVMNEIPMNTNIELMHVFIADYYGHRYGNAEWSRHANQTAKELYDDYKKTGSIAEFNSITYCGVDVIAFGMWRNLCHSAEIQAIGRELEICLWKDIGLFYNKTMHSICGPYSRNYDMTVDTHSSLSTIMFLTLGEDRMPRPAPTTESEVNPEIALLHCRIPKEALADFEAFQGERTVKKTFHELIERGPKADRRPLCTATARIEERFMMGALEGSQNTSGQLHPATIFWGDAKTGVNSIRLLRRASGALHGGHHRTVCFSGHVEGHTMKMDVDFQLERKMELYFEIEFANEMPDTSCIRQDCWQLPGLRLTVEASKPYAWAKRAGKGMEVVYTFDPETDSDRRISFTIHGELV